MQHLTLVVLGLASAALSTASALGSRNSTPKGCNADNCLRALRATARISLAQAGCSAWLTEVVTETPPPVIVTEYSTSTSTTTVLVPVTATTTDPVPTTVVEYVSTHIETSWIATTTVGMPTTLRKRDATPTIPVYATACSGEVRYTSACSCIGITSGVTTETLNAATTTTTLPSVVVETITEPTTVATVTARATTTIRSTATSTTTLEGTATAFLLQHYHRPSDTAFAVDVQDPESRLYDRTNLPPSRLVLEPDGSLTWEGRVGVVLNRTLDLAFPFPDDVGEADVLLHECAITPVNSYRSQLTCSSRPGSEWHLLQLVGGRFSLVHAVIADWRARWGFPPLNLQWLTLALGVTIEARTE